MRPGSFSMSQRRGSFSSRTTPRCASSRSRAPVTRLWNVRNDSPPGRPSHHSFGERPFEFLNISMTASSDTPSQLGILTSTRFSTVTGGSPVAEAIGAAVCCDRRAGDTMSSVAVFLSEASRSAASCACNSPLFVRKGSGWVSPSTAQAGCPWRTKTMSIGGRLAMRGLRPPARPLLACLVWCRRRSTSIL